MKDKYYQLKLILAFTGIYVVWGSAYVSIKVSLQDFPPFLYSALRFFVGATCLTVFCIFRREKFPKIKDIGVYGFLGVVMFTGGVVPAVWAQQYLPSYIVGCIITSPFWFVVLDKPNWKINFSNIWIMSGLVLGFIGVAMLLGIRDKFLQTAFNTQQIQGILGIIAGSFVWVLGSLVLTYRENDTSVYIKTCIHLFAAGLFILILSYFQGELTHFSFSQVHFNAVAALLYAAIFSTTLSFLGYVWLLKVKSPAVVSTYAYVNPLVAVFLGVFLAGETVTMSQILGLFVILLGVFLVNMSKYAKKDN
jgi:drug/metabolite transporter (DMT)-like permease